MPAKLRRRKCPNCGEPLLATMRESRYTGGGEFREVWEFYHDRFAGRRRKRRCRVVTYTDDPGLPFERQHRITTHR